MSKTPGTLQPSMSEVTVGLTELAWQNGNASKTSRVLAERGVNIKANTLRVWKARTHRDLYLQIQAEEWPKVRQMASESSMANAIRASEVGMKLVEEVDARMED